MSCWRFANEWLLNGEKICRPITWQKHSYWYKGDDGVIMYCDGTPAEVHLNQINADDWEIWKEEKSLCIRRWMMNKREQELEMLLWFSKNELYYDGSNVESWLPKLKKKLEEVFEIELNKEETKW